MGSTTDPSPQKELTYNGNSTVLLFLANNIMTRGKIILHVNALSSGAEREHDLLDADAHPTFLTLTVSLLTKVFTT